MAMKWVKVWWLIVILAVALVVGWEEKRCQAEAYQCRASYAAQVRSERLSGNISVNQQASEQQAIATACEPNGYFCSLFSAASLPSMLLVIIGIVGIWAALRTLRAIEKQADAQVNSERAWVIGELVPICVRIGGQYHRPSGTGSWVQLSDKEILDGYYLRHTLKIVNRGRTPATIRKIRIAPLYLAEDGTCVPTGDMIQGGIEWPEWDHIIGGSESAEIMELDVNGLITDLIKQIGDSKKSVVIHGRIDYQHVFSDTETMEAPFRYLYNPSSGRLDRMANRSERRNK